MKKTLLRLILVFCCLFILAGCGATGEPTNSADSTIGSSVQGESEEIVYSGDLEYYASLTDGSVYEDKIIEVTGEFTEKSLGNYYIGDILDDFYVFFYFDKKTDEVKQLVEGDIITVRGKCVNFKEDKMQMSACELISVSVRDESSVSVTTPTEIPETSIAPQTTDTPKPSEEPIISEGPIISEEPTISEEPKIEDTPAMPEKSTFSVHFIDVGQADAALIECDGHYMLIDGGNKADSNIIYSVLKNANVEKLDIVVGTHAHEDHIGGIPGAFNYTTADLTLCATNDYDSDAFKDFKKYTDQNGGGIIIPSVGDTYSLGSANIEILGVNGGSDTNDTSIVLMITYGDTKFLFTGDAEREAEQAILNYGADLSATVLKVGHHGSETSTTYPFLREIMPEYAVISVGTGNSYGHPTENTLSRLRDADVKVYRTDLQGDIKCTSDGKSVEFSVARNATADTLGTATKQEPHSTATPDPTTKPVPSGTYYVLNTNSKKFHDPNCGSVNQMSESNKEYSTSTGAELVAEGYEPCGNCKPYEEPKADPEPEPTSTPTPTQTETMVWIPQSGSKYHSHSGCSNMKNPSQVTKSQAESSGFTPCKKCW